jgi:hypothetical protein
MIKIAALRRPIKATHAIQLDAQDRRVRDIPLKQAVELQGNEIVEACLRVYRELGSHGATQASRLRREHEP